MTMNITLPLLLDGATGTELQKRGFTGEVSAEQWTLQHPDAIREIQRSYLNAGSRVLYTPTFGANRVKLEAHGLFGQTADYNRRLTALTREVAADKAFVAGDIAPTGLFLTPMGETSFAEFVEIYTEQAQALEDAGVDLFVIETMMTLPEARAAVLAVKSVSRKPILVSFTCDENGRTLSGTDVAAALLVMQGMGVDAFGLNCSAGPKEMLPQLQRLHQYATIPLIAKPNAGLPEEENGQTFYRCSPEEFASYADAFAKAGVALFGGCCGTTEAHIAALREAMPACIAPAPLHPDLLPAATGRDVCLLPADIRSEAVLPCDDSLEDALEEVQDCRLITITIQNANELDSFADCQYAVKSALCLACDDAALLEQALRLYQGRALYEGSLHEDALAPLAAKYGLIY
jgi:5-methyltetrahydrofolate--homocysteine methyltransferase